MAHSWLPITEIAAKVNKAELRAIDLVEQALKQIDEQKSFNAIIASTADRARERAIKIDSDIANGSNSGRLAGVPFIAKDNFLVFGADTTAASNILKGFDAPYQSSAIERLEAEGAICVAKANLDAFAHGSSTENSDFFTTKNPHDVTRVPGGSSGGSAAAVMLDLAPFALGTDTGGSIRLPASFTGAVGYKPTYGLVSRSGVVAMASSTDVVGPITRSVSDAALVLDVMSGQDDLDSTTIARNSLSYLPESDLSVSGVKIGVIKEYMGDGLDPEVKSEIKNALSKLKMAGAEIIELSLPSLPLALAVYYIICPAEVSSNLSRYDGQRYGFNSEGQTLSDVYTGTREKGFGKEAKRRIMIGTYVLSSGYYDAYYKQAQTVRTKLINEFADAFKSVDFLVGPTAPEIAFKIGANSDDPLKMYLTDIMTVAVNLAGIPAISVPAGKVQNMPVGLQIIADQRKDKELITVAAAVEQII